MNDKREVAKTIVRYTTAEAPCNGYPRRIVSPPLAGSCCLDEMVPLGSVHWDDELPYIYRRCGVCGHTVRHFLEDAVSRFQAY